MERELKVIREVILEVAKKCRIGIEKIILFGSRARGDCREDSDWDILIVTDEKLDWKREKSFLGDVYRELGKRGVNAEVILSSARDFDELSEDIGTVHHWAKMEGIVIA